MSLAEELLADLEEEDDDDLLEAAGYGDGPPDIKPDIKPKVEAMDVDESPNGKLIQYGYINGIFSSSN